MGGVGIVSAHGSRILKSRRAKWLCLSNWTHSRQFQFKRQRTGVSQNIAVRTSVGRLRAKSSMTPCTFTGGYRKSRALPPLIGVLIGAHMFRCSEASLAKGVRVFCSRFLNNTRKALRASADLELSLTIE